MFPIMMRKIPRDPTKAAVILNSYRFPAIHIIAAIIANKNPHTLLNKPAVQGPKIAPMMLQLGVYISTSKKTPNDMCDSEHV